jgi:hypothetical protein
MGNRKERELQRRTSYVMPDGTTVRAESLEDYNASDRVERYIPTAHRRMKGNEPRIFSGLDSAHKRKVGKSTEAPKVKEHPSRPKVDKSKEETD